MMKVPMNQDTKGTCICMSCPTFMKNDLMTGVFCSTGSTEKMQEMKGCNCPGCQVYAMLTTSSTEANARADVAGAADRCQVYATRELNGA